MHYHGHKDHEFALLAAAEEDLGGDEVDPAAAPDDAAPSLKRNPSGSNPSPRRCLVLSLFSLGIVLICICVRHVRSTSVGVSSGLNGLASKFAVTSMTIEAFKDLFGGADPFEFQCPLPGLGRLVAVNHSADDDPAICCTTYDRLSWPYQFPECHSRSRTECPTCWDHSPRSSVSEHPVGGVVGVAWAASLSVYRKAKSEASLMNLASKFVHKFTGRRKVDRSALAGHKLIAALDDGLQNKGDINVCPGIDDWEETMLYDGDDNIHARALKSDQKKIAVVVFRGTQMTSMKNWEVDANLARTSLSLGDGFPDAKVHEGFSNALDRVLPDVKKWLVGYMFGIFQAVPEDWTIVFSGHSLGGALAILAATMAELHGWDRKPDAVVVFGAPRVADGALSAWWKAKGMCDRLIRVNVVNDVIHYMPLKTSFKWWSILQDLMSCASDLTGCLKDGPTSLMAGGEGSNNEGMEFSDRWDHVCGQESEILVQSATKGVNPQFEDFSPIGGAMAHFIDNCLFGYTYGVLHSTIVDSDRYCSITPDVCSGQHDRR